jgi:hypothetical protein
MLAARARPDGETHGTSHCVIPISPADARAVDPGAMASNTRNDSAMPSDKDTRVRIRASASVG